MSEHHVASRKAMLNRGVKRRALANAGSSMAPIRREDDRNLHPMIVPDDDDLPLSPPSSPPGAAFAQDALPACSRRNGRRVSTPSRRSSRPVTTTMPILSPQTVPAMEQAIYAYQDLVARGGWNSVPADKELQHRHARPERGGTAPPADRLGRSAPDERRRRRLRFLCAGGGQALPGAPRHAGRRRRRRRHAEGAECARRMSGWRSCRPISSASGRWACRASATSWSTSRRADRGGGERRRRLPPHRRRRQGRPADAAPFQPHHEINFNPFWTVPASIIKKDLIPKMQKEPNYLTDHHIRIYNQQGTSCSRSR